MKAYFLRLTEDDFEKDGTTWTSGIIDLYDTASDVYTLTTPSYTNYSVTKSNYGVNALGDQTWVGLEVGDPGSATPSDATPTDTGLIVNNRFLDLSGRIDIFDWNLTLSGQFGEGDITPTLDVFHIDDPNAIFPLEWAKKLDIAENRIINVVDSYRYFRVRLNFSTDQIVHLDNPFLPTGPDEFSLGAELLIKLRIDEPVMAPLYTRTRNVLNKFPQWMEMRSDINETGPTLPDNWQTATPTTIGAQLLNAVAGQWLDEIDNDILSLRLNQYISTADLNQTAWVYKSSDIPVRPWRVEGDGVLLANTADLEEFYDAGGSADAYYYDKETRAIFTRRAYTSFRVNDEVFTQQSSHVWNWFDEFGASLDLFRLAGESNDSFKKRILDVYANRPGVGIDSFKLALRRELNIWQAFGATPDSNYFGATPEVVEMFDLETDPVYTGPDGVPTQKFKDLVEWLAETYPVTWGYFKWDEAYWDIGGDVKKGTGGFSVMPHQYDVDPLPEEFLQAGVGDGDDLYVYRPDEIAGAQEFNLRLKTRGRRKVLRDEWPKITINAEMYGTGDKDIYDNPLATTWVSVALLLGGATPGVLRGEFEFSATSDVDVDVPLPTHAGWAFFTLFEEGILNNEIAWRDGTGDVVYGAEGVTVFGSATPRVIETQDVDFMEIRFGRFDFSGATPVQYDLPTDDLTMWATDDPGDTIDTPDAALISTFLSPDASTDPVLVIQSNETSSAVGRWESPRQPIVVELNGKVPNNSKQDTILPLPVIIFDPNLTGTPDEKYEIQVVDKNFAGDYIATSVDADGNPIEIPIASIAVNADTTWTAGLKKFDVGSVTDFLFSDVGSATPAYPVPSPAWEMFEYLQTGSIYGVVDENGPWRNGVQPAPGDNNFNLTIAEVDRGDFTIPDDEDHVPTWMGVEVIDNSRVTAWLDSNTINPAADDDNEIVYPANAIEEVYDDTLMEYSFTPFVIRARLKPGPDEEWNPQINSGWFYEGATEYYTYAQDIEETATSNYWVLGDVSRMGAPIIIRDEDPVEFCGGYFDDFNRPDHPFHIGVSSSGAAWYRDSNDLLALTGFNPGKLGIKDNQLAFYTSDDPPATPASLNNFAGADICLIDLPDPDHYVQAEFTEVESDGYIIMSARTGRNSTVNLTIFGATASAFASGAWLAVGSEGVAFQLIDSAPGALLVGATYRLEVEGDYATVFRNGTPIMGPTLIPDHVSRHQGGVGFLGNRYWGSSKVDNFEAGCLMATPSQTGAVVDGPVVYRQFMSYDESELETATPAGLSQYIYETLDGSGATALYLGYEDVYGVRVRDRSTGFNKQARSYARDNVLITDEPTGRGREYDVSYKLRHSFYANNEYLTADGDQRTQIVFDAHPATPLQVVYETSKFDPATPVHLPLNTFYTIYNEGFIFISHDEYELTKADVRVSPSTLVADGEDFLIVSIRSIDVNGNPKPNQAFTVSTDFGVFDDAASPGNTVVVTTNNDGFAVLTLTSETSTTQLTGTITITGTVSASIEFNVDPIVERPHRIVVVPDAETLPADGIGLIQLYGVVEDPSYAPVPYARVKYRRGRSIYDVFTSPTSNIIQPQGATPYWDDSGTTIADENGQFVIGPWVTATPNDPGFWFLAAETEESASPSHATPSMWDQVGDVAFWLEYPDVAFGVNEYNELPHQLLQFRNSAEDIPEMATVVGFPYTYDDATPYAPATPVGMVWSAPKWYAINKWKQHELGILGTTREKLDFGNLGLIHPDYKEL